MTTNLVNGKIYIGKHETEDPNDGYLGSGKLIRKAIEKYSEESFSKDVLYIFDNEDEMNAKEAELVTEEFIRLKSNYNLCPGGKGGFGYINERKLGVPYFTSETSLKHQKLAVDNFRLKMLNDPEWQKLRLEKAVEAKRIRDKLLGNVWKDKKHTEKTKNKMHETHKLNGNHQGEKNSQFGSIWITNGIENRKIKKVDTIPEGFKRGRINSFNKM